MAFIETIFGVRVADSGIVHQLREDPFEVGEGILAVTPDLLDESVDYRTGPTGLVVAE